MEERKNNRQGSNDSTRTDQICILQSRQKTGKTSPNLKYRSIVSEKVHRFTGRLKIVQAKVYGRFLECFLTVRKSVLFLTDTERMGTGNEQTYYLARRTENAVLPLAVGPTTWMILGNVMMITKGCSNSDEC